MLTTGSRTQPCLGELPAPRAELRALGQLTGGTRHVQPVNQRAPNAAIGAAGQSKPQHEATPAPSARGGFGKSPHQAGAEARGLFLLARAIAPTLPRLELNFAFCLLSHPRSAVWKMVRALSKEGPSDVCGECHGRLSASTHTEGEHRGCPCHLLSRGQRGHSARPPVGPATPQPLQTFQSITSSPFSSPLNQAVMRKNKNWGKEQRKSPKLKKKHQEGSKKKKKAKK